MDIHTCKVPGGIDSYVNKYVNVPIYRRCRARKMVRVARHGIYGVATLPNLLTYL